MLRKRILEGGGGVSHDAYERLSVLDIIAIVVLFREEKVNERLPFRRTCQIMLKVSCLRS